MKKFHFAAALLLTAALLSSCNEKNPSQPAPGASQSQPVLLEKTAVRTLALAHAGLAEGEATFTEEKLEAENGQQIYDLEFFTNTAEYDYEVNAVTGEILSYQKEIQSEMRQNSAASQPPASAPSSAAISLEKAKELALSHASLSADKATFTKAELDYDDGKQVYDLEFVTGTHKYDYEVDAASGKILSHESEMRQNSAASQPPASAPSSAAISLEKAKELALSHAGLSADKATFTKAELDYDDGKQVYDLEFVTGTHKYDYEVDAASGKILSHESEIRQSSGSTVSQPPASSSSSAAISLEKAKELALSHAGLSADKATFTKAELDYDDGKQVYDLEFVTGTHKYDYEVDAASGKILSHESEMRQSSGSTVSQPPASSSSSAAISLEKAKELALSHAGLSADKATFTKAKLDYEDGKQVYDLEFVTGTHKYDYEVDAASGKILSHESEMRQSSGSTVSQPPASAPSSAAISLEKAKELALSHAGLLADKATFTKAELDYDDGKQVYDLEFVTGTTEYEYELDLNGNILSAESEARH